MEAVQSIHSNADEQGDFAVDGNLSADGSGPLSLSYEKVVHVLDPLFKKAQSKLFIQMHEPTVNKVAVAVANCIENFFENWNLSMHEWDVKFVEPTVQDATSAETGLLTLMYIREFDGSKIHNATRDSFLEFKKLMLYELMCLKENYQKAPVNLTISIDD